MNPNEVVAPAASAPLQAAPAAPEPVTVHVALPGRVVVVVGWVPPWTAASREVALVPLAPWKIRRRAARRRHRPAAGRRRRNPAS
ncbi:hypothetical protein [Saccharothrix yanglingensis]|uniref:hypothetical protein n=1 Tax=Saccharothrix yanglingensis TaxID=659496 RepID=UPI0027D2EA79|nr:hypothetical protein [Saccharothrix yanglingensis]